MEYYRIAVVVRPHGVHGGVKLLPLTDDAARFHGLKTAYLEKNGARSEVQLMDVGVRPDAVTLRMQGVATIEQAEKLRGAYLCVDAAHARKLPPDTWFIADLVGCEVRDTEGTLYGRIVDVLQTGANDVYELDSGTLLPALKKLLCEVDVCEKRMIIHGDVAREVGVFAD